MTKETHVSIRSDSDIVTARKQARELAQEAGFSGNDQTIIVTAISEVARNIVEFAHQGEIVISLDSRNGKAGIDVVARDEGPGIANVNDVLQDETSAVRVPGLGLSGVRRIMDTFEIVSEVGKGTTIMMKKWAR